MHKSFNMILTAYVASWVCYLCFNFLGIATLNPKFENDFIKLSMSNGYVYQSNPSVFMTIVVLVGFFIGLISIIGMFFRLKYTNATFIFAISLLYISNFIDSDTISVMTNYDYIFEYTSALLEGAIISLVLFHRDIGFPKIRG